jgi:hypothetical protein
MKKLFIIISFAFAARFDYDLRLTQQTGLNADERELFPNYAEADSTLNCTAMNGYDGRFGDLWCEIASK